MNRYFMPAPKGNPINSNVNKGGRPLIYDDETINKYADEFEAWMEDENHYWLKDFFLDRKLRPQLMTEWAAKHQRFSDVVIRARQLQEGRMFKGAMSGLYNPMMTKLGLTNHHQWADKSETKISGDAENPFSIFLTNRSDTANLVNDEDQ